VVIPRKEGGTGIIDTKNLHNRQIIKIGDYFHCKQNIPLYQIIATIGKGYTPLNLADKDTQMQLKTV
jgi:hypothetical protein